MKSEFYANFEIALNRLESFIRQGIKDDLDRAGLIQGFEFTYEQSWKAIQKKGGLEGVSVNSPKQAFTWAIEIGWIPRDQEPLWRQMIEDRNLTTHTYREAVANAVADRILESHAKALADLLMKMRG